MLNNLTMKKPITIANFLIALGLMVASHNAGADDCDSSHVCSGLAVTQIHVKQTGPENARYARVLLQVDKTITHSCRWFGRQFRLDILDPADEAMYSALLTYVSQRKRVHIWFEEAPGAIQGTDATTGCVESELASIRGLSANFSASEFDGDPVDYSTVPDDVPFGD